MGRAKVKKQKKKLTAEQRAEKRRRKALYETIFINGKQKRVKKYQPPDMIDGHPICDPIYLHQNEMWPELQALQERELTDDVSLG